MEQRESLNRADNDLKGITMRTHKHCQSYRVRIRMKGGQYLDRSFKSKTLAKKWKRDMESAIEHDRYEFTNPATKHTLAELIDLYIERVLPSKPRQAQGRKRVLDEVEQKRLLQACEVSGSKDLFLVVALALGTGMRKGEIMCLRWKDINFSDGKAIIFLEKTKNGRPRSILITGLLLSLLQNRRANQRGDSLLFPSPNCPSRPIDIRSAWEKALDKAGIEGFVFHGLRHQAASCAATIENNPLVIGELLGHETLQMTKHYVHLPSVHMHAMVEALQTKVFQNYREVKNEQPRKSKLIPTREFWRSELLTEEEIYKSLKDDYWTARTAAYYILGLKAPDLESLEEEKKLCPDFEKYHDLFEECFAKGKIAVHSHCLEYGKTVCSALPVDWLKLVHKGRLKDDAIEDRDVKRDGLYVVPALTAAWLLMQEKLFFQKGGLLKNEKICFLLGVRQER